MELVERADVWRSVKALNAAREHLAALLVRTRWLGSPLTLPPSQVVPAMSDEWLRELEKHHAAHPPEG